MKNDDRITIRLTKEDKEQIKARAAQSKCHSVNEYICKAALGIPIQRLEPYQKAMSAYCQLEHFANVSDDPKIRKFLREVCDALWQSLK